MRSSLLSLLLLMTAGGGSLVGGLLLVRAQDQRRRDARRVVVTAAFPRGLKDEQTMAMVRAIIGLSPAKSGLVGRDAVALELIGRRTSITYRFRFPASSSTYLIAQLRAAVPGIAIDEVDDFQPERWRLAVELKRRITTADLATSDTAAVARTFLAALGGVRKGEAVVWLVIVSGGIGARPAEQLPWHKRLSGGVVATSQPRKDEGVVGLTIRIGAMAASDKRAGELVARLRRAAASLSAPKARLVPRWLPRFVVADRVTRAATPITASRVLARLEEVAALMAWPVQDPLIANLPIGGSPQLPASPSVPTRGRVLGRSTADGRPVAQPRAGASEHALIIGPTGVGKTWLGVRLFLDDVARGNGGVFVVPKRAVGEAILERLPEEAIGRTVVVDPMDEARPVPMPLLTTEPGGIPELAPDTVVALLRHRNRDLGPRSTDILTSSLYALARVPNATLIDLLKLWNDPRFRAAVVARITGDLVLASFFAWFDDLGAAERSFVLAPAMNKIRPLLQRSVVRNVLAAPRSTFTFAQAMRERLNVIVMLDEGKLGRDATTLLAESVVMRIWAAIQARSARSFYSVTIDEAPRFLDLPTDLGDVLARSREYGVGVTLIGQSLGQFPDDVRDMALNSARTKIAFGTSSADAKRLAAEFGPGVQADYFTGLARYEAIGAVSLGGTVSAPFTFRTEALPPPIPGRAKAIRTASRERFGVPRDEIEASFAAGPEDTGAPAGPVGRRAK